MIAFGRTPREAIDFGKMRSGQLVRPEQGFKNRPNREAQGLTSATTVIFLELAGVPQSLA